METKDRVFVLNAIITTSPLRLICTLHLLITTRTHATKTKTLHLRASDFSLKLS